MYYTFDGLLQWATKIVPTLFPFMILSSLMILSGIDILLVKIISIVLKPFFPYCSDYGIYVIFMGFLCGFPMGAKTTSELYLSDKISLDEANYLLSFCNNIGPSYFLGLILPILHEYDKNNIPFYLFGMYGIPLVYGIIIGLIKSKKKIENTQRSQIYRQSISVEKRSSFSQILKNSFIINIKAILLLGAYISFVSALRTIPDIFITNNYLKSLLAIILEINSGIKAVYTSVNIPLKVKVLVIMTGLSFSGISCFAQTACFTTSDDNHASISFMHYFYHRIILTLTSFIYYILVIIF